LDGALNVSATNTTLSGFADGPHNLIIYATDLAGNENSSKVFFSVSIPVPEVPSQTNHGGGIALEATINSADVATRSPTATSQIIVQNGRATLWNPMIVVDSVCEKKITPPSLESLKPNESATFTVDFDCEGVPHGDYPVTYTLQLASGKVIASKTYTLTVKQTGVIAPSVVILATISPSLTPGETGTVTITLQNSGNVSTDGNVELDVPAGLFVSPSNIPINLQPGEMKNVSFQVTAPTSGTTTGLGVLTGFASFFGVDTPNNAKVNVSVDYQTPTGISKASKEMEIGIIPRFPYVLIVIFAGSIGLIYYYFFYRTKLQKKLSE
jgi:uncharacterized cupredoxin-like copper-binding protein